VATGVFDTPPFDARHRLVADWRFIAYVSAGAKAFANVHVAAGRGREHGAQGREGAVSFLANTNAGSLSWSPDGTT
jgi:hypothetical protein